MRADPERLERLRAAAEAREVTFAGISAVDGRGLEALVHLLYGMISSKNGEDA